MQDKAIAAIGKWQLEEMKRQNIEPADFLIENMFPGKDYQMLLLIFEIKNIDGVLTCEYKGIDIEKVSSENIDYRKFAYRKGPNRGGDITFTTKISSPVLKKIITIKNYTFKNVITYKKGKHNDTKIFEFLKTTFLENESKIISEVDNLFKNFTKEESFACGMSIKIIDNGNEKYLRDYDLIKEIIIESGATTNYTHAGIESKTKNKISSVSGKLSDEIFGFAAPFKFSSPDKPGFISGFFNKKLNWRNYPISEDETLILELGRKYIQQHLTGYFYGHQYYTVPNPIIQNSTDDLEKIINLLKSAFDDEKTDNKEKKRRAEDRVQKIIANEKNYFNLDLLFVEEDKKTGAITINLMLEELLPSRFRQLFIDMPEKVQNNKIFKNAIVYNKELHDLNFSFQIIKDFFSEDFLDITNKLFLNSPMSNEYVFEKIINLIRKNYNKSKTQSGYVEFIEVTVKKSIMLLSYLQELKIIKYNQNYKYMEIENTSKKESRFNTDGFNNFVKENSNFLDSDIKVGIFAVGVLVRFLFDIQSGSLHNTPFENKLRGYKLNPELLMNIYTEALDKIQKYLKTFYVYTDLREIINNYFVVKSSELTKMSNNELSFYFVAGLEMGRKFKNEKQEETIN